MNLGVCLGQVAPFYNLVLVLISIGLFVKLFSTPNKKTYIMPWKLLFVALLVYVIEEVIAILDITNIVSVSKLVYPIFEMIVIFFFTYIVLLQKNYLAGKK